MKKMRFVFLLFVFLPLINLLAQEDVSNVSESHRYAAIEFLEVMKAKETFETTIDSMLEMMVRQNPGLARFEEIIRNHYEKYFRYEDIYDDFLNVYIETFTEEELNELVDFYKTETGQKSITVIPETMQKGMAIGEAKIKEHLPELQQAIMNATMSEESGLE